MWKALDFVYFIILSLICGRVLYGTVSDVGSFGEAIAALGNMSWWRFIIIIICTVEGYGVLNIYFDLGRDSK